MSSAATRGLLGRPPGGLVADPMPPPGGLHIRRYQHTHGDGWVLLVDDELVVWGPTLLEILEAAKVVRCGA
jgi:hypothetical protein